MLDDADYVMRDPQIAIVTHRTGAVLIDDRGARDLVGVDPDAVSLTLQAIATPVAYSEARRRLAEDPATASVIAALLDAGALLRSRDPEPLWRGCWELFKASRAFHLERVTPACENVVFGLTGSILAGFVAPWLLSLAFSRFQRKIDVIFSESSLKFVNRDLFEHYGFRTWSDAFVHEHGVSVPHVELARAADLIVVCPASARTLHKLASGSCEDLLGMVVAASKARVLLVPSMNEVMWEKPSALRNASQARRDGMFVLEPTIMLSAADFIRNPEPTPVYGAPGLVWLGPKVLLQAMSFALGRRKR